MARHTKQKLIAQSIVQFHVAGKLFVQYVNYVNKCWKLDSIARSLFSIRVHVPCTKLYYFIPKYQCFYKFQLGIFQSVDSLILLHMCTPSVLKYTAEYLSFLRFQRVTTYEANKVNLHSKICPFGICKNKNIQERRKYNFVHGTWTRMLKRLQAMLSRFHHLFT